MIDVLEIIWKYYKNNEKAYKILLKHSEAVRDKALEIANNNLHLNPDIEFIKEASMLHDIGMIKTNAHEMGCFGDKPYIAHGYLGREMLESEGLLKHALVCERHVGVGITKEQIIRDKLNLPLRNYLPETVEEKAICLADNFFSKSSKNLKQAKSIVDIKRGLRKYGEENVKKFEELMAFFI